MKIFTILKGDSQRIPAKNFVPLGKKPLFRHLVDSLYPMVVYANCDQGARQAMSSLEMPENLRIINRNERYEAWESAASKLGSPVEDMLFEFARDFAEDAQEVIVLTHVTSPFLERETLVDAALKLEEGYQSVHSVKKVFDFAWLDSHGMVIPINFDPNVIARTQDLPPVIISKGAFFMARAGDILRTGKRMPPPTHFYELSTKESVEIDYPEDLHFARQLLEGSE